MISSLQNKRRILSLIFSFILSFSISAGADNSSRYGGQLVLSTTSDPKTFNDITANETSSTAVTGYIFEGLLTMDAHTLKVKPNLAESWTVSENGLTWIFKLRNDVKWSDGEPFTADDVIFTFNDLIYNPDIPNSAADSFTIEGKPILVEKIDTFHVKCTLPVKFAPFLLSMTTSILPKHKLQQSVADKTFNHFWGIDTDPKEIVGTGPFKLVRYDPGERIVFERNPLYWKKSAEGDKLPYIDRIVYLIVQDSNMETLKFIDGEIDANGLDGRDYPLLKPREQEKNFTVYNTGPGMGTSFVVLNQNTSVNPKTGKPFADPVKLSWFMDLEFRKAIAHAIDRQRMIEILMNGLGYEQHAAMSQGQGFFFNPNVIKYDFNLEQAKKILTDAGYIDRDGDGIIEDKKGNKVEFNLMTPAGGEGDTRVIMAGIIRNDLQKIGMKVNLQAVEFNILVSKLNASFDWDAVLIGLTGGGPDPNFGKNVWASSGQLHMWYPKQKTPATDWEKRVDDIFNLGVQELDETKRKVLYDEFQMIVSQQVPMMYTVLSAQIFAVRNKFGNLDPAIHGGPFHNIEEIYIKPEYK